MRRRGFGRQGTVSAVGFGCMSFSGFYGPTTEGETMRALVRALELGVDFWDTANVYGDGLSETMISEFLADRSRRSKITLATKFAIRETFDEREFRHSNPRSHGVKLEAQPPLKLARAWGVKPAAPAVVSAARTASAPASV